MKKTILALVLITASFFGANAQPPEGFQFGAGIRAALPIGDFADSHSFGVGGEIQGEYGFSDNFSAIVSSGYTSFFGKETTVLGITVKNDAVGLIPVIAGVRVYPSSNIFIGAQAGIGILTGGGDSESAFMYQPQVGFSTENFQIALNYNGLSKDNSTLGHIGLTAIYKFGGGGNAKK
jgi:hypothetical protein